MSDLVSEEELGGAEARKADPKRHASKAAHDAPRPFGSPAAIPEQLLVGTLAAFAMAIADAIVTATRDGQRVSAGEFAIAVVHLVTMYLAPGLSIGLVVGSLLVAIRLTPWLVPIRLRLGRPRRWFLPDPEGFSAGAAALVAAGVLFVALWQSALHFATRYHRPELASVAMAAVGVGLVAGAVLIAAAIAALLRPIARLAGRVASIGTLIALVVVLAIAGTIGAALAFPQFLDLYDPADLVWGPVSVLAYIAVAVIVRVVLVRRAPGANRVRLVASIAALAVLAGFFTTALAYGESNRVRAVVEHRSVLGQKLLRGYLAVTDRDGDGHAWAFGGGDCDDGNPDVRPGALDATGDGVDADCFGGDGSPEVAEVGDGHYGVVPPAVRRPNFLLLSIDALRPDHLGCHGYRRRTSPKIDAFCREAVRFENVIAPSSRSIRSIPAAFTGFYPSQVGYGPEYLWPTLLPENATFAESLRDRGWNTAATIGTDYFERLAEFFQGFEEVNQSDVYKPPRERVTDDGIAQLRRLAGEDAPWAVWIHWFNVHEPYLPDGVPSRFGERPVDKYDTEIALVDAQVDRVLKELERLGEEEDTVVILFSDHGEAFGEHGSYGHAYTLFDEELKSVIMIRAPGFEPKAVRGPISLIDLAPTVLNLARIPMPKRTPARSLVPLMLGGTFPEDRLVFSELMPDGFFPFEQKIIRRGSKKLQWWVREGTFQLYDLARDPGETNDISDERRDEAEELLGLLRAWVATMARPDNRQDDVVERNRLPREPARMTKRLNIRFPGEFTLLGYDMPRTTYAPGDRIPIDFYYRVDGDIDRNLYFDVTFDAPPGYPLPQHFHAGHFPMNGRYFTHMWQPGEILRDPVQIVVPHDIRRPVKLTLGLTVRENRRLPVPFEGDVRGDQRIHLTDVEIR